MRNLASLALVPFLALPFASPAGPFVASPAATSELALPAAAPPRARAARAPLTGSERDALRAAERRSSGLGELRGGDLDLSDRDLTIILVTIGVVILLILIF